MSSAITDNPNKTGEVMQTWTTAGATLNQGKKKSSQEDAFYLLNHELAAPNARSWIKRIYQRGLLYIVADGVGGLERGEEASEGACQIIRDNYYAVATDQPAPFDNPVKALYQAIMTANHELYEQLSKNQVKPTGTTLVCAVVMADGWTLLAHAGDSRAYCLTERRQIEGNTLAKSFIFRDNTKRMFYLTNDHSWTEEEGRDLVQRGYMSEAELAVDNRRHMITRVLGTREEFQPQLTMVKLGPGDRLLLCSDGLWEMLEEPTLASILATDILSVQERADRLIQYTLDKTIARDNLTALVVDYKGEAALEAEIVPTDLISCQNEIARLNRGQTEAEYFAASNGQTASNFGFDFPTYDTEEPEDEANLKQAWQTLAEKPLDQNREALHFLIAQDVPDSAALIALEEAVAAHQNWQGKLANAQSDLSNPGLQSPLSDLQPRLLRELQRLAGQPPQPTVYDPDVDTKPAENPLEAMTVPVALQPNPAIPKLASETSPAQPAVMVSSPAVLAPIATTVSVVAQSQPAPIALQNQHIQPPPPTLPVENKSKPRRTTNLLVRGLIGFAIILILVAIGTIGFLVISQTAPATPTATPLPVTTTTVTATTPTGAGATTTEPLANQVNTLGSTANTDSTTSVATTNVAATTASQITTATATTVPATTASVVTTNATATSASTKGTNLSAQTTAQPTFTPVPATATPVPPEIIKAFAVTPPISLTSQFLTAYPTLLKGAKPEGNDVNGLGAAISAPFNWTNSISPTVKLNVQFFERGWLQLNPAGNKVELGPISQAYKALPQKSGICEFPVAGERPLTDAETASVTNLPIYISNKDWLGEAVDFFVAKDGVSYLYYTYGLITGKFENGTNTFQLASLGQAYSKCSGWKK